MREHLATARATGEPGTEFRYENGNVEALAEVLRRITGLSTSALMSEMVWSRVGAEEDAYCLVDTDGPRRPAGASVPPRATWPASANSSAAAGPSATGRSCRKP
ncbi:serine hydrolase [Streptomyces violaceorubidus]